MCNIKERNTVQLLKLYFSTGRLYLDAIVAIALLSRAVTMLYRDFPYFHIKSI